jgi:hypothetical protein
VRTTAFRYAASTDQHPSGIIGAGIASDAPCGYAANNTSLTVGPGQGGPAAQFTVMYRWPSTKPRKHSDAHACIPDQITFEWDGSLLGRAASTLAGDTCIATLHAAPPPGAYHGASTHTISVTNDASTHATYTVIERPAGPPSAGTSSATPDSTTDPTVDPQVTGLAGVPAAPSDAASPTALANGQQGAGSGLTGWLIAFGAVLFLAGAGTFGVIAWRTRHPSPDAEAPWSPADTDTQPLSLGDPAARRAADGGHRRSD